MEVYLVPIGRGRHALYCEPGDDPRPVADGPHRGVWRRLSDSFSAVIATVEREHGAQAPGRAADAAAGWWPRLRARVLAWVAEKIAEQRLLWRLRGKAQVSAKVPDGLDAEHALAAIRGNLSAEFDRHRLWMAVDAVGGLLSAALMFIPGPNVIGYYFAFRIVGHFLSLRGARHGLTAVRWNLEPSPLLAELSGADSLPADEREARVQRVAERLGLPRFPRFYRRTAVGSA